MKPSLSLVFFGSGPVAAETLQALLEANFFIEAIITKPRAFDFHGKVPVIELAQTSHIPFFTPQNKQELSELFTKHHFTTSLGVVVDYGIIIGQDVIDAFANGILNSHFSLLPEWRGADPITFALLSGQKQTGVSLMLINCKLDEGMLIDQRSCDLPPDITVQQLTNELLNLSSRMLIKDIPLYINNKLKPFPQPAEPTSYSRKIKKEDGLVDWDKPAERLEREVRAYLGWPKSQAKLFGKDIIITKVRVAKHVFDGGLVVACQPGFLEILELTAPSGRTMSGADFIRGYKK